MKGPNHVYECQVQNDSKLCMCAIFNKPNHCKNPRCGQTIAHGMDYCNNSHCEFWQDKSGRIKPVEKPNPKSTKHTALYNKVNEIIDVINSSAAEKKNKKIT